MSRLLRLSLRFILLFSIAFAAWKTGRRLIALEVAERVAGLDGARAALSWDPENPEFFVRSARAKETQLGVFDLRGARSDWERALRLNPHYWSYWLEYGRHLEIAGEPAEAERAFREAIRLSPRNGSYPWALANFFIRQGEPSKALESLRQALLLDDFYLVPSAQLLLSSKASINSLQAVWPERPRAAWLLFSFIAQNWDRVEATWGNGIFTTTWKRLLASHAGVALAPSQVHPYLRELVERGYYQDARTRWVELMDHNQAGDAAFRAGREFVWNGDFETLPEQDVFDWQIIGSEHFEIRFARLEGVDNSTALRIRFRGRMNPEFANLRQRLVLEPGKPYRFRFRARTQNLSSSGGFHWVLRDLKSNWVAESQSIQRTNGWQEFAAVFRPPPQCEFLELTLQGLPSDRSIDRLDAVLWVDGVSLSPADSAPQP